MVTVTEAPPERPPGSQIDAKCMYAMLMISQPTFERHLAAGKVPTPRRVGRLNRWDYDEIREWLRRPKPDGRLMTAAEWTPVWQSIVKSRRN